MTTLLDQIRNSIFYKEGFDPMIVEDPRGIVIDLNKEALKKYGWKKKEIVGSPISKLIPQKHIHNIEKRRKSCLKNVKVRNAINYRKKRNGRIQQVLTTYYLFQDKVKDTKAIVNHDRLIPEEDEIIKSLNTSKNQLKMIMENTRDGIHQYDLQSGRYIFMSPSQERLTGFKKEELMSSMEESTARLHPDDREKVEKYLNNVIEGKDDGKPMKYRWKVKSGEYRWFSDIRQAIRDKKGKAISLVGVSHDITERVEYENKLKEADQKKNEFLAMMAHELRNPLSTIINAYDLKQHTNDSNLKEASDKITYKQLTRLKYLIDDLVNVSRITRGNIVLRREPLEISEQMKQAAGTVESLIKKQKHKLYLSFPSKKAYIHADPIRIQQIFTNLLDNAIKYTPEGGEIRFSAKLNKDRIIITCRDNGRGISQKDLSSIFEPFTQIYSTLDRQESGLGIGLSLVKKLVELHDGYVKVESEGTEKGSNFTVGLPVATNSKATNDGAGFPIKQGNSFKHRNILIAEDNEDLALMMEKILENKGHNVEIVNDGVSAIDKLKKHKPEIALLDLGLPQLDGYKVAKTIRKIPKLKNVKLIGLSGYDPDPNKVVVFDKYFVKPVSRKQLLQIVNGDNS